MMKPITWLAALTLSIAPIQSSAFAKELEGWSSNYEESLEKAKKQNKAVLINFTGSDWCPPCIHMEKNVFSKKEFVEDASKTFVLLTIDFPKADNTLVQKNTAYAQKYNVEAFPTVVITDAEGKAFHRLFASDFPTVDGFLKHINSVKK